MRLQRTYGVWMEWVSYSTSYTVMLIFDDPDYPYYRVSVEFRNDDGTSEIVWDDIIFEVEEEEQPSGSPLKESYNYTIVYILVAVLIGLIGIGIYLKFRKKRSKSNFLKNNIRR